MTSPAARYQYNAHVVDLIRGLEQRAAEMDAAGYEVATEHTTRTTGDEVSETITVHWRQRPLP